MGLRQGLKNRVRAAVQTATHGYEYGRHLVQGNKVGSDMAWTRAELPPVVLVHGFLGTRGTMLPLARRFQADGRVVFSYAYGTFNLGSIRRSAEDLARQLRTICEKLEVERVDLVGYSMGGLISLHALKFLSAHQHVRSLVMMGSPLRGTWVSLAGVATVGAISPSVWQILPGSPFLEDLMAAPVPEGVRLGQIHAASDALCPPTAPIEGVAPGDYVMLAGGHSSLVVTRSFYEACKRILEDQDEVSETETEVEVDELEHVFAPLRRERAPEATDAQGLRLVVGDESR